jgi:hypothetical protein
METSTMRMANKWYSLNDSYSASPMHTRLYTPIYKRPGGLLLSRVNSLLEGLAGAWWLLYGSFERLVGYDDIVELVL